MWLLRARFWLPWWLFRWSGPSEAMVLDWRYLHGWGRVDDVWRPPAEPVRSGWDRFPAVPQHMCRDLERCPCFEVAMSGDLVVRDRLSTASHTGG